MVFLVVAWNQRAAGTKKKKKWSLDFVHYADAGEEARRGGTVEAGAGDAFYDAARSVVHLTFGKDMRNEVHYELLKTADMSKIFYSSELSAEPAPL